MSVPLLTTKLHIPHQRGDLVPRLQLLEQLNQGVKGKLTLVSAPAGFGKSSLLSAWISQTSLSTAWVSLDEADNEPTHFLMYLIAALQSIEPPIGEALLPALQSPQPPQPSSALPFLINDLVDCDPMVLVLDDYHVIKDSRVHGLVKTLLQQMPPNLHLVMATRADPPLPLSLLRGRQQLVELRTADLRFGDEEAEIFFNQTKGCQLSSQDVLALNTRTEGWITGLQMALLSMQGQEDKSQFIRSFTGSNRYILDYLLEEVLDHQPEEIRGFLLKTSILDQFSGSLCQTLTGEVQSQQILETLERANLFLIPLDEQRGWFRYHHLFADLLRQRLMQTTPDAVPKLRQSASIWYEENGFLGDAIDQALAIEDCKRTVRLLKQYIQSIWEYGDQTRLTRWLASLPEEEICKQSTLLAHHAFALSFSGQFVMAEKQLSLAEKHTQPGDRFFIGMAATVRAFSALYSNEIKAAANYAQIALQNLPDDQHTWRSLAFSVQGDVHAFFGHVPTCAQTWGEALSQAEIAGRTFFALWASSKVIIAQKRLGKLQQAAQTFHTQIKQAREHHYDQIAVAGALYAVYGDVLLEWNRVDEASEHYQRGLALSERQNYMAGIAWSLLSLISAQFSKANRAGVEAAIRHLDERLQWQNLPFWTLNWLTAWKARLQINQGKLNGAENLLQARGITLDGEFNYPNEVEYLVLARLLMAKGYQDDRYLNDAQILLSRLRDHLESKGWIDKLIEARLLQALIHQEQGNTDLALELLASTLDYTEPEGYIRVFTQEGAPMARLLFKAIETNLSPTYLCRLLAAFPSEEPKSQNDLIDPLSHRELEVLDQLAAGATNQEAALALHIAPGTVKNHLKKIYGKLSVHNRTQAVTRARALGLLE